MHRIPLSPACQRAALDLYQKGTAAAQKGDAKGAVDFLSKAVSAHPNFASALSDLGAQYLKLFQWDKAAETFEALVKLKPDDAGAHLDLGIALYYIGSVLLTDQKVDEANQKLGLAEVQLREAIKLNNPGPSAHYYLGMTLVKTRRYAEAQTELELAIKNGGDNIALAHRYLGGLYQAAHKNKEAADELKKYLKLDPKAKDADKIKQTIRRAAQRSVSRRISAMGYRSFLQLSLYRCRAGWFNAGGAFGRRPDQTHPSPEQDDVIRVNTELVQTDVMVFDKKGHFVDGLKAEQFALRVDKKPQTISFFDRVTSGKATADRDRCCRQRLKSCAIPQPQRPTIQGRTGDLLCGRSAPGAG